MAIVAGKFCGLAVSRWAVIVVFVVDDHYSEDYCSNNSCGSVMTATMLVRRMHVDRSNLFIV